MFWELATQVRLDHLSIAVLHADAVVLQSIAFMLLQCNAMQWCHTSLDTYYCLMDFLLLQERPARGQNRLIS